MGGEKRQVAEFRCPLDCLAGVGEVFSGQYDVPGAVCSRLDILDIGANCGSFALWALARWPESSVVCYEPQADIFENYLRPNTAHDPRIRCEMSAVGDILAGPLRPGLDNRLCSSLYDIGRQGAPEIPVAIIPPEDLPEADVVKVDTEGSEGFILEHLRFTPALLVVEYHTERLRERVMDAVAGDMDLVGCQVLGRGWGHLKFVRRCNEA